MAITIIAKNVTGDNIDIEDLGITIAAGSQSELSDLFTLTEITNSLNLYNLVNDESLVINDGSSDLNKDLALDWITLETIGTGQSFLFFGNSSDCGLSSGLMKSVGGTTLGYKMPGNGVIKSMGVVTDSVNSNTYQLLINNTVKDSLTFSNSSTDIKTGLAIAFGQNDLITANTIIAGSDINSEYNPDTNTIFLAHFDGDDEMYRHVTNSSTVATGMSGRRHGADLGDSGKFDYAVDFDGYNDYVEFLHHDDYETQNATVEFFFNPDDVYGSQYMFSKDSSGRDTGGHLIIGLYGNEIYVLSQSSWTDHVFVSSGINISPGNWYHIAVVLGSAGIKVFLEGILIHSSSSWTQGLNGNRCPFILGGGLRFSGDTYICCVDNEFNGKICELRISSTRRYESNFSPTSSPFTNDSDTLGLWHLNETNGNLVYDSSNIIHNAMMQTTASLCEIKDDKVKIGTHAIKMNNSMNDWLRIIHNPNYETMYVTVEGWMYPYKNVCGIVFQKGDSYTEGGLCIKWNRMHKNLEITYYGASTSRTISTSANSFKKNEWHHFSITIDDNNLKVNVDGNEFTSEPLTSDFQNVWMNNKEDITMGSKNNYSCFLPVYLDEVRISKIVRLYSTSSIKEVSMTVGAE